MVNHYKINPNLQRIESILLSALAGLPRLCQLCEGNIRTVPTIKCDGQHHLGIVGRRLPHLLDVQIRRYEVSYISRMTTAAGNAASTEATSPNSGFACPFTAPYIFTLFNQGCHRWRQRLPRHSPNGEPEVKTQKYVEMQGTCVCSSLSLLFNSDTSEALVVSCKPMKHKLFREGQLPVNEIETKAKVTSLWWKLIRLANESKYQHLMHSQYISIPNEYFFRHSDARNRKQSTTKSKGWAQLTSKMRWEKKPSYFP